MQIDDGGEELEDNDDGRWGGGRISYTITKLSNP